MVIEFTYFNARGAGEISRMICAVAEVEFTDTRVEKSDWMVGKNIKAQTPLGQMPTIKLDNGNVYSQSLSIARYLAREHKLAGQSPEEMLHAEMIMDTIWMDLLKGFFTAKFEEDLERKKKLFEQAVEKATVWMTGMEKYVHGESTFLTSGLSMADIFLFNLVHDLFVVLNIGQSINIDTYPKLKVVYETVSSNENMKKYLATRPETAF